MDKEFKINELVYRFRKARGITQKELAEKLHVAPKTVSNWERNRNFIPAEMLSSIIKELEIDKSFFFNEYANSISVHPKIKFFCCPVCNNITWSFTKHSQICCGNTIYPLISSRSNYEHYLYFESSSDGKYITVTAHHPMKSDHHIKFIAYVSENTVLITLPEINKPICSSFMHMKGGKLYFFCSKHGLFDNTMV